MTTTTVKIFEARVQKAVTDEQAAKYLDALKVEIPYTTTQIEWARDEIYSQILAQTEFKEIEEIDDIEVGLTNPQLPSLRKDGVWIINEFHTRPTKVEYYIEIHNYNPLLEESPLPYLFDREEFIGRLNIYPLHIKKIN